MSLKSRKFYRGDSQLADTLLRGYVKNRNGRLAIEFLSSKTRPTEKEARAGLARLLAGFAKKLTKGPLRDRLRWNLATLLAELAQVFDAMAPIDAKFRALHGIDDPIIKLRGFARLAKRNPNKLGDYQIAVEVERLIQAGQPKLKVYGTVAEKFGLDRRQIERICRKCRQIAHPMT